MSVEQLFKSEESKGKWLVCPVDGKNSFLNILITHPREIAFSLFKELQTNPYLARLSTQDLMKQLADQGFVEQSARHIQSELYSQSLQGCLKLEVKISDSALILNIALTPTLNVLLSANLMASDDTKAVIIYRGLVNDILLCSHNLQRLTQDLENLLHTKDRAIDYFKMTIEELGGEKMIKRWAPKASSNAKALEKFCHSKECRNVAEKYLGQNFNEARAAETGQYLFDLQAEIQKSIADPNSPRKRLRRMSSTDFLPYEEPLNTKERLKRVVGDEAEDLDPVPSTRSSSESPSRKRKFRKVKITKK